MSNRKVNVYVFGAGASVHVGGPLTKDFLSEGFSKLCAGYRDYISEESFHKVACLIDTLYGSQIVAEIDRAVSKNLICISDSSIPQVTIEELLTYIDIALSNKESWLPFEELRQAVHNFIFETLDSMTLGFHSDVYKFNDDGTFNHRRNCYDKLIDNVITLTDHNCFISFNYDLFLDKAVSINNHSILGDYNLEFVSVEHFASYKRIQNGKRTEKDVDILKLHGSINWARCPVCNEIYLEYFSRYRSIFEKTCKRCGKRLIPILVPPTLRKQIEEYGIGCLWDRAEEILSMADNIIIIGYSFPDVDTEAKWLFKRSLVKGGKKPTLTLVEPNTDTRKKIIGMFGNTVGEVFPPFHKFEDYIEQSK